MRHRVVLVLFVALAVGQTAGASDAENMGHWKCVGSLSVALVAGANVAAGNSTNHEIACGTTGLASIVLASLGLSKKRVSPRHLTFGDEEWMCLKRDEYEAVSQHLCERALLDRLILALADRAGLRDDVMEIANMLAQDDIEIAGTDETPETTKNKMDANAATDRVQFELELMTEAKAALTDPHVKFDSLEELTKVIALGDLRDARRKQKISQRKLAEITGLTQPQISKIEQDPSSASPRTLRKLATALGVKIYIC